MTVMHIFVFYFSNLIDVTQTTKQLYLGNGRGETSDDGENLPEVYRHYQQVKRTDLSVWVAETTYQ